MFFIQVVHGRPGGHLTIYKQSLNAGVCVRIIDTAHIAPGTGSMKLLVCLSACLPACLSVCLPACLPACLSVCSIIQPPHTAVAGLLLWAQWPGDFGRLLVFSSKCEQCHVVSWHTKLNTDLSVFVPAYSNLKMWDIVCGIKQQLQIRYYFLNTVPALQQCFFAVGWAAGRASGL